MAPGTVFAPGWWMIDHTPELFENLNPLSLRDLRASRYKVWLPHLQPLPATPETLAVKGTYGYGFTPETVANSPFYTKAISYHNEALPLEVEVALANPGLIPEVVAQIGANPSTPEQGEWYGRWLAEVQIRDAFRPWTSNGGRLEWITLDGPFDKILAGGFSPDGSISSTGFTNVEAAEAAILAYMRRIRSEYPGVRFTYLENLPLWKWGGYPNEHPTDLPDLATFLPTFMVKAALQGIPFSTVQVDMPWNYLQLAPDKFLSFQKWAASAGFQFEVIVNSGLPAINPADPPRTYDPIAHQTYYDQAMAMTSWLQQHLPDAVQTIVDQSWMVAPWSVLPQPNTDPRYSLAGVLAGMDQGWLLTTPANWGSEFLVNTTTAQDQSQPSLAALADGRFVIAWTDNSVANIDGKETTIRAQLFNTDGSPWGSEFLVSTTNIGQTEPTLTALSDGRFVIAWTDTRVSSCGSNEDDIRAQVFNPDGTQLGSELLINTTTINSQSQPSLTALANGRFAIVWTDNSASDSDSKGSAIRAQLFNADGNMLGSEFLVSPTTNSQTQPTLTALSDGRFVVVWTGSNGSSSDIWAQLFNPDGTQAGRAFLVNTTSIGSQLEPTVTALVDGRFVVAWTDNSSSAGDQSGFAIRAQVFYADGNKSGNEVLVTTTRENQTQPTLTALADGRFMVAWTDNSSSGADTSGSAIRGRVFYTDGSPSSPEFLLNTTRAGDQSQAKLATLADGRLVSTWTDDSHSQGDPSSTAIRAQILDPRQATIDLTGTPANDTFLGTAFGDRMRGSFGNDALAGGAGDDELYGEAGEDILWGGPGNDPLFGGDGNDTLLGEAGIDRLDGGAGNDSLDGGSDSDLMLGGRGDDTYSVENVGDIVYELPDSGSDTVLSSVSYTLPTNVENLVLTGTANLTGTGNELKNTITGNSGNNTLDGGLGADHLSGGSGNDTYIADSAGDIVDELPNSGSDTVLSSVSYTLPSNTENLTLAGTANLSGVGNELNNTITGNSGNNLLDGGPGADNLSGGSGDDTYIVDNAGDIVDELPNSGVDTVWSSVSYSLSANIENLILTGTANLYAIGNDLNNNVTGNSGNNTLNGGAGSDNLSGGSGDDTYIVDNAGDIVSELPNSGIDTVRSSINYMLPADIENLTLLGMANLNGTGNGLNNNIVGNSGNNTLVGGNGNDTLNGEAGDDLILTSSMTTSGVASSLANGGPGNDSIVANGQDTALGGDGNDLLYSSTGDWVYFDGGNGNDTLIGNRGVNILAGGADTDVLIGGLGNDYFYGGPGSDYFNLSSDIAPGAMDSIGDWSTGGVSDAILLPRAFSGSTAFYQYGAAVLFLVPQGGAYYFGYVPNAMVADVRAHTFFV